MKFLVFQHVPQEHPGWITKADENFCHKFTFKACPANCQVSPSCPVCLDIGCHQKGAHTQIDAK